MSTYEQPAIPGLDLDVRDLVPSRPCSQRWGEAHSPHPFRAFRADFRCPGATEDDVRRHGLLRELTQEAMEDGSYGEPPEL